MVLVGYWPLAGDGSGGSGGSFTIDLSEWDDAQREVGMDHFNTTQVVQGYQRGSLEHGLVAYYPLDEGSGTTAADAALDHDATISGATWNGSGQVGADCLSFDGTDDYAEASGLAKPDGDGLGDYTMAFFTSYISTGNDQDFFRWGGPSGSRIYEAGATNISWNHSGISETKIANTPGVYGEFIHYGFVFVNEGSADNYTIRFYADGVLEGTLSTTQPSGEVGLRLGNKYESDSLNGKLDDFRVYDRALSEPEMVALAALTQPSTVGPEETL